MPQLGLILHQDRDFRDRVRRSLRPLDLDLHAARADEPVERLLSEGPPDLVVVELGRGQPELLARLRELRDRAQRSAILAVAEPDAASSVVETLGQAVDDYLLAPGTPAELRARAQHVLASRDLHRRLDLLQVELSRRYGARRIVCRSTAMEAVYQRVLQLAPTRTTVLVTGESGAGKELIARSLHYDSPRRDHPFVAVNCAALTESLIESELFGHERGAFTGATETVPGKFELAHGGTLFLDEVGTMGAAAQVKLLRVLEEGEIMRVGGRRTIRVDVRVVAATNSNLDAEVAAGGFRKDLLYRLRVASIHVPPLRQRRDDIAVLARTFATQLCEENGLPAKDLDAEAVRLLAHHDWPGNVRELKNLLESLVVTVPGRRLGPEEIRSALGDAPRETGESHAPHVGLSLAEVERLHLEATLRDQHGNRTRSARMLGIGLRTLQRKIKQHGIEVPYEPDAPTG